jgi:hypothetical protein
MLKGNQVVEAILLLLLLAPRFPATAPGGGAEGTWRVSRMASAIRAEGGVHKFCANMHVNVDQGLFDVEYAYCELFHTLVLNDFVRKQSATRDHRALFAAAPRLAGLVLLVMSAVVWAGAINLSYGTVLGLFAAIALTAATRCGVFSGREEVCSNSTLLRRASLQRPAWR